MLRAITRICLAISFPIIAVTTLVGCQGGSIAPESETLTLPDGTVVEVTQDEGAVSLANSRWELRSGGTAFVTFVFDAGGNLTTFQDFTLASDILGSEIILDDTKHDTGITGVQYSAVTFEAETEDGTGFTFVTSLFAFVPIFGEIASGTATATSTLDPADPDIMTGDFVFDITFDIPDLAANLIPFVIEDIHEPVLQLCHGEPLIRVTQPLKLHACQVAVADEPAQKVQ